MDAQARQALRSFATAPNAETARAALRAWRHGAAPPAVLRWALEVTTWDALDAELQTEVALAAARRQASATRDAPAFVELRACLFTQPARELAASRSVPGLRSKGQNQAQCCDDVLKA